MAVQAHVLPIILAALLPVQAASVATSNDECLPGSAVHCIGHRPVNTVSSTFDKPSLNGTISNMLMPVTGDMMESSVMAGEVREQAMRFSMAQNVTWILSGNWSLSGRENVADFDAVFTKVTIDGEMRHTHRISNFTLSPVASATSTGINTLYGTADLYFNDELAWKQAEITLTFVDYEVLVIKFDSDDIDSHFHGMPIYGVLTK